MKYYEITIENGHYPLTYSCSTIAEAFGCLSEAAILAPRVKFDPDDMMEQLAAMRAGKLLACATAAYRIAVMEGEV